MSESGQKIEGAINTLVIYVKLEAQIKKEKPRMYVSHCPALDLYSQGETIKETKENMSEAVSLFIASCYSRGVLNEVLKDCGFIDPSDSKRRIRRKKAISGFASARTVKIPARVPLSAAYS